MHHLPPGRSSVSATPPSPAPGHRAGWFADRPLAVKFGVLVGIVVLAFGGLLTAVLMGNAAVRDAEHDLAELSRAQQLVLQLDTRASELKVDGYKATVRPDPQAQLAELADDIAAPEDLITDLGEIALPDDAAVAVAELQSTFGEYTDAITAFVNVAITDQAAARVEWERIQAANDLTDGAVGAAKDAIAAAHADGEEQLDDTISRSGLISITVAIAGLLVILGLSWLTMRSVTRPVQAVKKSLEALATGDLTVGTGVTSRDEVGLMAASLDTARTNLRDVLEGVASSAQA